MGFDEGLTHIAKWLTANVPAERIAYRSNTSLAMTDSVRAGIGVARLPRVLGDPDASLRRLEPSPMPEDLMTLWLLTHPDRTRVARIRSAVAFLAAASPEAATQGM